MLTQRLCGCMLASMMASAIVTLPDACAQDAAPQLTTHSDSAPDVLVPPERTERADVVLVNGCQCSDCNSAYAGTGVCQQNCPRCGRRNHRGRWHHCRDRWQIDYARPFGESVHSINQAQVSKGDAAQMVLYDFDFRDGEALLNLSGLRRLDRIVRMLPSNYYPIIIEGVDHDPTLAAARREEVLNVLHSDPTGFPVPQERVVIADPPSPGLDGLDAVITHEKQLGLTTYGIGPATSGFETADVPVIAPVIVGPTQ